MAEKQTEALSHAKLPAIKSRRHIHSVIGRPAEELGDLTNRAILSVSSCKLGRGVENLLSDEYDQFWQSDGSFPHCVTIQFKRKTRIDDIYFFTDYERDETYTPRKVSVRVGSNHNDLQEVGCLKLQKPKGWIQVKLSNDDVTATKPIRCFMVQIAVTQNHHLGMDSRIGGLRIFGSPYDYICRDMPFTESEPLASVFSSVELSQHCIVR